MSGLTRPSIVLNGSLLFLIAISALLFRRARFLGAGAHVGIAPREAAVGSVASRTGRTSALSFSGMSVWKDFGTGAVVIDDRYSPILITTFFREISLQVATWHGTTHQAMVATQARRAAKAISITDSSHTKAPPAEVRKYWGELTKNFPTEIKQATLVAIVVIKSPIIRGVMTALSWLNPELRAVEVYDSVELAVSAARERLRKEGQAVPTDVSRYELPPDARAALAKWVGEQPVLG